MHVIITAPAFCFFAACPLLESARVFEIMTRELYLNFVQYTRELCLNFVRSPSMQPTTSV